jgi:transposase
MKDGRTHLAHKQEHAVDMESGAVVAVEIEGAAKGDTSTVLDTVEAAESNLEDVRANLAEEEAEKVAERPSEFVGDKGYHSKTVLGALAFAGYRTYIAEPRRGRRVWDGDDHARETTYGNRRRIRDKRGRDLMRRRGELIERSFAHNLETGGMRRTHLRHHDNILKRVLVHVAAFNLCLVMRSLFGFGKPRVLQGRSVLLAAIQAFLNAIRALLDDLFRAPPFNPQIHPQFGDNLDPDYATAVPA